MKAGSRSEAANGTLNHAKGVPVHLRLRVGSEGAGLHRVGLRLRLPARAKVDAVKFEA